MSKQSNWQRQHQTDEDFTRAAWDLAMDAASDMGVNVSVQLYPSIQRGVWVFVLEARSIRKGENGRIVAAYQGSYPNGTAAALSSYLFRAFTCIVQMCESARTEEDTAVWGRSSRQPSRAE